MKKLPLLLWILLLARSQVLGWVTTAFCREQHQQQQQQQQQQIQRSFLTSGGAGSACASVTAATDDIDIDLAPVVVVPTPKIRWTVPGMKLGWQDEDGNWWDEDGIRQGPPMNYWRQKADERAFEKDMAVLEEVLAAASSRGGAESPIHLPSQLSLRVKSPLLNNKLLGVWAPIVRNGRIAAVKEAEDQLRVRYTISIARPGPRKLGPTTGYGTFDAHLEHDEPVSVTVLGTSIVLRASQENNNIQCIGTTNVDGEPLSFGRVKYLSDYLLIMANEDGTTIREFWTRVEPIESVSKEEAARLREVFERQEAAEKAPLETDNQLVA